MPVHKIEILKIRNAIYSAIDDYFKKTGFYEVAPPILTPFTCEVACVGGSDLISVNYYGRETYLSQSGQLYLESMALQLEKVYCVSPTFRAEPTLLAKHLSEFWMCEAEIMNISFEKLIQTATDLIVMIIKTVLEKHSSELTELKADIPKLEKTVTSGFQIVTYSRAIEILQKEHVLINWGEDIKTDYESVLFKCFNDDPLVITHYPKSLSSFYKAECFENPQVTLSFDIVAPHDFRELVGGSMREVNREKLMSSLIDARVDLHTYEWYVEMISKNPTPHGGFGLGIERLTSWLCNCRSITDAIPFPRTENVFYP